MTVIGNEEALFNIPGVYGGMIPNPLLQTAYSLSPNPLECCKYLVVFSLTRRMLKQFL